ncbi:hypothetical protein ACNSZH_03535 [Burkholderia gladioli]
MIEEEIAEGSLVPLSPDEAIGPYGYWLDIAPERLDDEHVGAFVAWLRGQAAVSQAARA